MKLKLKRFNAFIIDLIVITIVINLSVLALVETLLLVPFSSGLTFQVIDKLTPLFGFLIYFFYFFLNLVLFSGQTLGMKTQSIKLDLKNTKNSNQNYFTRSVIFCLNTLTFGGLAIYELTSKKGESLADFCSQSTFKEISTEKYEILNLRILPDRPKRSA